MTTRANEVVEAITILVPTGLSSVGGRFDVDVWFDDISPAFHLSATMFRNLIDDGRKRSFKGSKEKRYV